MTWRRRLIFTVIASLAPGLAMAQAPAQNEKSCPTIIPPTMVNGKPAAVAGGNAFQPAPCEVEGLPIEVRPPELATDKPAFPGQTRAPYHKSKTSFKVSVVTDKLNLPWSLQFLPDGKMLVTEKPGTMRIVSQDGTVSDPLKGVPESSYSGDAGLLDVALDPDFASNHVIYFNYIRPMPGDLTRMALSKATLDEAGLALNDLRVIFQANEERPKLPANNQNGRIVFAKDGTLFMSFGGRGELPKDSAQNPLSDLGKIVHITKEGAPVKTNPFYGKSGYLPEIYSIGHRTPEGIAFDAKGQLWETEHGPRGGDELNLIKPGANYGWPLVVHGKNYNGELFYGGQTGLPNVVEARYYWDPVIAPGSLTFYHGKMFPEWEGNAFVAGLRAKFLTRLTIKDNKVVSEEPLLADMNTRIRDMHVAPDGSLYVLTDEPTNGKILRISAN
jgi:glucose/arabinose dehydrogenase